jgi:DNA-binding transcriptional LysR family regulator
MEGLLAIVASGEGVGLAPAGVVHRMTGSRLTAVPVSDIPQAELAVAWRTRLTPLGAAFVDACLAVAGQADRS